MFRVLVFIIIVFSVSMFTECPLMNCGCGDDVLGGVWC